MKPTPRPPKASSPPATYRPSSRPDKALKDKKAAVVAFDKLARGKWPLFTGPLVNLTEDTFDIGLEYTPQLPNDPMGMSRQFFEVSMSKVEGYTKEPFKSGNAGVVLAKYNGAAQASPATSSSRRTSGSSRKSGSGQQT